MWNNVVNAWWPLIFYPATDAPKFHNGMIAMICICGATLAITWGVWYMERREWRLKRITDGDPQKSAGDENEIASPVKHY